MRNPPLTGTSTDKNVIRSSLNVCPSRIEHWNWHWHPAFSVFGVTYREKRRQLNSTRCMYKYSEFITRYFPLFLITQEMKPSSGPTNLPSNSQPKRNLGLKKFKRTRLMHFIYAFNLDAFFESLQTKNRYVYLKTVRARLKRKFTDVCQQKSVE